jgi:hypothetical protein
METDGFGRSDDSRLDEIFTSLQPRMRSARTAHLRRFVTAALAVPILVLGAAAAAMSVGGEDRPAEVTTARGDEGGEVPDAGLAEADDDDDRATEVVGGDPEEVTVPGTGDESPSLRPDPGTAIDERPSASAGDDAVERVEIALGDVAVVVVEREGETLWIDVAEVHEWWEPVVTRYTGPSVAAHVANDGVEHHVEASVNGGGELVWETWTVEHPFFDQWVEVSGVGAVRVLVEANTIRVTRTEAAEGFVADVEVELADGGDAVVVAFRGEGVTVIVRVWPGETEATWTVEEVSEE